jgi:hypothetical protein
MNEDRNALMTRLHNEAVHKALMEVVKPTLLAGGHATDIVVIMESIVTGVFSAVVEPHLQLSFLDLMMEHIKDRLTKNLSSMTPAGEA